MGFAPSNSSARSYRSIGGSWGAFGSTVKASLTTALAGNNNDLTFTSTSGGANFAGGNSTRVRYVVSGNSTPLSVSVSGSDITVNVATDGSGNPTSTATQAMNAINGNAAASALVTAALATGNDGTGVVAALAFTSLSGGQDYVIGTKR